MRSVDASKKNLLDWVAVDNIRDSRDPDKWHAGDFLNCFPGKNQLRSEGLLNIVKGWLPSSPIIDAETRVLAVGSCFARNFTLWLAEHGFNRSFIESPYNALLRFNADFESPAAIAQQFRWAFDEVDSSALLWIDKRRNIIEPTEEGRCQIRLMLEQTDVLIITLGLSEVWYDKISDEPLWRAVTERNYNPARHVLRVESVAKTLDWLSCIERLRRRYIPRMKVVYTLSPVPLKKTFRPISAITANTASKAIIRAALDEFIRANECLLNREIFYFPSYEMVLHYFIEPFREDGRHLAPIVTGSILAVFSKYFCSPALQQRQAGSLANMPGGDVHEKVLRHASLLGPEQDERGELVTRIAELEEKNMRLQRVCDERQIVISQLNEVAGERLLLIKKLDAHLKNLR